MTEIRCDSATLHVYSGRAGKTTDQQLGDRQFFNGQERVSLPLPGDQNMRVYAWLWKGDDPVLCTHPTLLRPGETYRPGRIVYVTDVGPGEAPILSPMVVLTFPGEEFYDYYDSPTVFCKWPGCDWRKLVDWGEQEAAFRKHFQETHADMK